MDDPFRRYKIALQGTTGGGGKCRNRGSVDRAEKRTIAIFEISTLFLPKLALSAGSRRNTKLVFNHEEDKPLIPYTISSQLGQICAFRLKGFHGRAK